MSVDPTYSENVNKSRYNNQKNWDNSSGKPFATRTSINTAL